MEQTVNKLLDIVMSLFHKLVNVNQSFHLTLINIAFCNLQDKAKKSIASFFSPTKIKNVNPSVQTENIRHREQEDSKGSENANKSAKSPPSNLQKWLNSSNSGRKNTLNQMSDADRMGSNSAQTPENKLDNVTETALETPREESFFGIGVKRKKDIEKLDEKGMEKKKRFSIDDSLAKGNMDMSSQNETRDRFEVILPSDIDQEVFSNLPFEVQQEVIQDIKSKSISKTANSKKSASNDLGMCGDVTKDIMSHKGNKSTQLNRQCKSSSEGLNVLSDRVTQTLASADNSKETSSKTDKKDSLTYSESSGPSIHDLDNDCSFPSFLPPNVDPEVFVNLPPDIQKEILDQYKHNISKDRSSGCAKQNQNSKKPSILNYFGTSRKS